MARPPWHVRLVDWLPFVASAALVALAIHLTLRSPWLGVGLFAMALLALIPARLARRRARRLLASGDVEAVLAAWRASLRELPHRETMAPLITATALTAHGLTERARLALDHADRGAAWEAALEHRLFIETLLDAFEGERQRALDKARALASLPLPPVSPVARGRVSELRSAALALARAFAHVAERRDVRVLRSAARKNPLVSWAMRYAAAVACVDQGDALGARRLLEGAPPWPDGSVFQAFHAEISAHSGAGGSHRG